MAQELGRIEKPEVETFRKGRKIYMVPLIYLRENAPQEYIDKFDLYWKEVVQQIENLEIKLGSPRYIFHESVSEAGEPGLKTIEKLNSSTFQIIKEKYIEFACIEAMEDRDLLEETLDWQRCLLMGFMSAKATEMVSKFYIESSKKRYEHIGRKIDETLKQDEVAIVFINERNMVQFAGDIEVFRIAPPALNEIYKWLRERQNVQENEKTT